MKNGIEIENIECKLGLTLINKFSGNAACVTSKTSEILVNRGWGILIN